MKLIKNATFRYMLGCVSKRNRLWLKITSWGIIKFSFLLWRTKYYCRGRKTRKTNPYQLVRNNMILEKEQTGKQTREGKFHFWFFQVVNKKIDSNTRIYENKKRKRKKLMIHGTFNWQFVAFQLILTAAHGTSIYVMP